MTRKAVMTLVDGAWSGMSCNPHRGNKEQTENVLYIYKYILKYRVCTQYLDRDVR